MSSRARSRSSRREEPPRADTAGPARRAAAGAVLAGLLAGAAGAAEFSAKPPLPAGTKVEKLEFSLWLPADDAPARSAIVIMSRGRGAKVYADRGWRDLATRLGAALILAKIRIAGDDVERASSGGGEALLAGITALGVAANQPGLAHAPLILWGHSRGGYFVNDVARWKPERVIGFITHHEGTLPKPELFTPPQSSVAIPGVYTVGEKDLDLVRKHVPEQFALDRSVGALRCALVEPGASHTDVLKSDAFTLTWIDAVHRQRLPDDADPAKGPVRLRSIEASTGWLADDHGASAAATSFPGKAATASWFPDEACAKSWSQCGKPVTIVPPGP